MTTETSIYEYAKAGAMIDPQKIAIWFYGQPITYSELFEKIDNLADHLYALGVREGTVVTIHLPNCPQAVMAIYAVAKLGGICSMVHPQIPSASLMDSIAITNSKVLFTYLLDSYALKGITIHVNPVAYMTMEEDGFSELLREEVNKAIFPDQSSLANSCAVFFSSSGTTGRPKTVMHCHAALNREVKKIKEFYEIDDLRNEVLIGIFPLFHCAGFAANMHLTLSSGAELVPMIKWDIDQAVSLITARKVTYVSGVPKIFETLLQKVDFCQIHFRVCVVAGEGVPQELKRAYVRTAGVTLLEGYGMTENVSAGCSETRFDSEPIGMIPFPGCRFAVLTNDRQILAEGEGELLLLSDTMMLGYLNESKTPFLCDNDGNKWFCSGDYGRIEQSGRVRFIRRIKNVIVRNGYNIYPEEIEDITREVEGVDDVCVIGTEEKQIVAFVVMSKDDESSLAEKKIRQSWAERLPRYATPQIIRFITSIPRNAVEKIDRKTLEAML
ncbi:MAG: acyl--CoA ligase [Oscillospiraceae bacterium]|nr:acyl--CoA ligase [Oscillospiraceae bacterium]